MMRVTAIVSALVIGLSTLAGAYPLDGAGYTGIDRLTAYSMAREPLLARGSLMPGSLLDMDQVNLWLIGKPNFEVPPVDTGFSAKIRSFMGGDAGGYSVAVLDLTDANNPRYAEVNAKQAQNPGSVGKIMVGLAFFQALADTYPDDIAARENLLRNTIVTATPFIVKDSHLVPVWKPGDPRVETRPIALGDQANLWTWLDWMFSASSNAAGAQVMAEAMLLKHFGKEYPVSQERAEAYFADTPKLTLSRAFNRLSLGTLTRNGIDNNQLRQGSFFTRTGKKRVPGGYSSATGRSLMTYLVKMEEGKLVDPWSSREIKRLLYLTDNRIRYASNPALNDSAVYFKSGSFYGCKEEKGFTCGKYMGNKMNFMNSLAVIETVGGEQKLRYIVTLLSNVLRKNSSENHKEMAGQIHELIRSLNAPPPPLSSP